LSYGRGPVPWFNQDERTDSTPTSTFERHIHRANESEPYLLMVQKGLARLNTPSGR
jgi:hypothetical protein